jgi:hypothetical protein
MKTSALVKAKLPQIATLLDTPLSELEWITGQEISISEMSVDELCDMYHRLSLQAGLPYAERLLTMEITVKEMSKAYFYVFEDMKLEAAFWDKVFSMPLTIEQIQNDVWRLTHNNETQRDRLTEKLQLAMDERLAQAWTLEEFKTLIYRLHSPDQKSVEANMMRRLEEKIRKEIDTDVPVEDLHVWHSLLRSYGSADLKAVVFEKLFKVADTYGDFKSLYFYSGGQEGQRIFEKMLALGTWEDLLGSRNNFGDSETKERRKVFEKLLSLADTIEKIHILYKELDRLKGVKDIQEEVRKKFVVLVQEQLKQELTFDELFTLFELPVWGGDIRHRIWQRIKSAASTTEEWKKVFNYASRKDERNSIIKKIASLI